MHLTAALVLAIAAAPSEAWQRVVGLLQYIEVDGPAALASGDEVELAEQRSLLGEVQSQLGAIVPRPDAELAEIAAISALFAANDAAAPKRSGVLARSISDRYQVFRVPSMRFDLERAAELYRTNCAVCHGTRGAGDGPAGAALKPPPASFLESERMEKMSPQRAFSATTFGVPGTAMVPFPTLTVEERWQLSFYVMTLRHPECASEGASLPAGELARLTDGELAKRGDVACLRQRLNPDRLSAAIARARDGVGRAKDAFARGDSAAARTELVDAYLEGLEPLEPALRGSNPALVQELEAAFLATRAAVQGTGDFASAAAHLERQLERAQEQGGRGGWWTTFFAAVIILMREGFEVMVVVGALLAVLKKVGATHLRRVVHLGWVAALVLTAAAFAFGQAFFTGARREWMEGLVGLLAVGLLLYAAMWLNARVKISEHMADLRAQMSLALTSGSVFSLFLISFTSAGREGIETALFLQGLGHGDPRPVIWGACVGLLALAGVILAIRAIGVALPMKKLFALSTAVLLGTAVVVLGNALHDLQEVGFLPVRPIPGFTFATLGIFPDAYTLAAQVLLAAFCWAWQAGLFSRLFRPAAVR